MFQNLFSFSIKYAQQTPSSFIIQPVSRTCHSNSWYINPHTFTPTQHNTHHYMIMINAAMDLNSNRLMDWHALANMLQARSHRLPEMLAYLLNNTLTKENTMPSVGRDKKTCIFGYKWWGEKNKRSHQKLMHLFLRKINNRLCFLFCVYFKFLLF